MENSIEKEQEMAKKLWVEPEMIEITIMVGSPTADKEVSGLQGPS